MMSRPAPTSMRSECPRCEAPGELGEPCTERACLRLGAHFIPKAYAEAAFVVEPSKREILIGQFIGDYLIVQALGKGGFGKVLLGIQRPLYRLKAAIKLLELSGVVGESGLGGLQARVSERVAQKFENEAAALAALQHPNIVRLLQYGMHVDQPFMVMELVPGQRTLQTEINRAVAQSTGFSVGTIRHLLSQILNGLEAAHDEAIIHRDIKPANIMLQAVVGDPMHVKLIDFGLAKVVAESRETSLVLGTVSYMAPEQIEAKHLGPWTDLYAVSAIAFELLTGQRLFPGEEPQQIARAKLSPSFDPFARFGDRLPLPEPVVAFLRKGLARYPEARFQTTREMRAAMQRVLAEVSDERQLSVVLQELADSDESYRLGRDAQASALAARPPSDQVGLQTGLPVRPAPSHTATGAKAPGRSRPVKAALRSGAFVLLAGLGALAVVLARGEERSRIAPSIAGSAASLEATVPPSSPAMNAPGFEHAPDHARVARIGAASAEELREVAAAVLAITSEPSGATIFMDDKEIGVTPLTYGTSIGATHKLRLQLAGYADQERDLRIRSARESLSVVFAQERAGPASEGDSTIPELVPAARRPRPVRASPRPPKPAEQSLEPVLIDED